MYVLAIDQGTSSTKCLIFDALGQTVAFGQAVLTTHYYDHGFVEQDADEIYVNVNTAIASCLEDFCQRGHRLEDLVSCGISNQRETFILWDSMGHPLTPAVVWACKRSVNICQQLQEAGQGPMVHAKTGLIIDPYFSATKLLWLLKHQDGLKEKINRGEVYFGTVDTWLLYKFTGGRSYKTDYTNAHRTLLFNIHTLGWDDELLNIWGLQNLHLPEVCSSSGAFGVLPGWSAFGKIEKILAPLPITAMIGDSHAATFGEACFEPGLAKVTLGTGCSIMLNTGAKPVYSSHGLLTTICWSTQDRVDFALEGAIVACGSTLEWLKNEVGLFSTVSETAAMAEAVPDHGGVYLIPAFNGLGAPHWQMDRRASLVGMTFGTTKNHLVRAALESIPYQIQDVMEAIKEDLPSDLKSLAVHGGLSGNLFVQRMLVDLLGVPILKQTEKNVSALGAAYLSGLHSGVYLSLGQIKALNQKRTETLWPRPDRQKVLENYRGWQMHIAGYSSRG